MTLKEVGLSWGMLAAAAALNVAGLYLVKVRLTALGEIPAGPASALAGYFLEFARAPLALAGVICIFAAPLPHAIAVSRMPLATAYPASVALTVLFLLPVSLLVLGEPVTTARMSGVALLLVSLVLLYR